jgi:DNA-binding SARP family transcriptional activator
VSEPLPTGVAETLGEDEISGALPQARLAISLFGGVYLRLGGRDVTVQNRKAKALIGYLALTPSHSETRERLVGMFWGDAEECKARSSLRGALHLLSDAFARVGFEGLLKGRNEVALKASSIQLDVAAVLQSVEAGRPHDLLIDHQRLTETLMAGYEDIDPSFRNWLQVKRQALHDRIARGLESVLRDCRADQMASHEKTAKALLNLDPSHEEAARAAIRARAEAGDIGGALRIYNELWEVLRDEHDTDPSKPTQELIARIKQELPLGADQKAAASAVRILAAKPLPPASNPSREPKLIVSVGELDDSAIRPEQQYLVQGFRRELIACLARFREWLVRDRVAADGLPATSEPRGEFVIEISAFQVADGVRLVLMLREAATNRYFWSERFQIAMANWFDAQQTIVRRLAAALSIYVSAERMAAVARRPVSDLKTYDLWLQGQATILGLDPDKWHKASDMFREVSRQMPDFAPARSSLAQLQNMIHFALPGVRRDAQRTAQALADAREAVRLDPIDSRSQLSLAWSCAMSNHHQQAQTHLQLALELNENDPWTLMSSAMCFGFCGVPDKARELADDALRLPLAPSPLQWAYHAAIRFICGEYGGCVEAARLAGETMPTSPGYTTSALFHLGHAELAARELRAFFKIVRARWVAQEPASDANITRWFLHIFPFRRLGDWERLRDGLAGAGAPIEGLLSHSS